MYVQLVSEFTFCNYYILHVCSCIIYVFLNSVIIIYYMYMLVSTKSGEGGHFGQDRMVVGFITTYAISNEIE